MAQVPSQQGPRAPDGSCRPLGACRRARAGRQAQGCRIARQLQAPRTRGLQLHLGQVDGALRSRQPSCRAHPASLGPSRGQGSRLGHVVANKVGGGPALGGLTAQGNSQGPAVAALQQGVVPLPVVCLQSPASPSAPAGAAGRSRAAGQAHLAVAAAVGVLGPHLVVPVRLLVRPALLHRLLAVQDDILGLPAGQGELHGAGRVGRRFTRSSTGPRSAAIRQRTGCAWRSQAPDARLSQPPRGLPVQLRDAVSQADRERRAPVPCVWPSSGPDWLL